MIERKGVSIYRLRDDHPASLRTWVANAGDAINVIDSKHLVFEMIAQAHPMTVEIFPQGCLHRLS